MTARITTRGPAPARLTRVIGNRFLLREDPALIAQVQAIKHRAAGEAFNPRTGCWERVRAS